MEKERQKDVCNVKNEGEKNKWYVTLNVNKLEKEMIKKDVYNIEKKERN